MSPFPAVGASGALLELTNRELGPAEHPPVLASGCLSLLVLLPRPPLLGSFRLVLLEGAQHFHRQVLINVVDLSQERLDLLLIVAVLAGVPVVVDPSRGVTLGVPGHARKHAALGLGEWLLLDVQCLQGAHHFVEVAAPAHEGPQILHPLPREPRGLL